MKQLKTTDLWRSVFALVIMLCASMSYSQDLAQAKALCGNVTAANKAMAKQAGYDLDALCSEVLLAVAAKAVVPAPMSKTACQRYGVILGRFSDAVAPVAVQGLRGHSAGYRSLKPFGYDLFANAPTTFAPAASIPVSADYLLGPGDTLDILFYGKTNNSFSLEINRRVLLIFRSWAPSVWRD